MADTPYRPGRTVSADEARQGEIVLRRRWQRAIFIAGLVGAVIIAILIWRLA